MKTFIRKIVHATLFALLVFASVTSEASAKDGLIQQLPKDGTWVSYKSRWSANVNGIDNEMNNDVILRSVGVEKVDDVVCRWIELEVTMHVGEESQRIVFKFLTPETELKTKGLPMTNAKQRYLQIGDGKVKKFDPIGPNNPFLVFMTSMIEAEQRDPRKLRDSAVKTNKYGELTCTRQIGTSSVADASGVTTQLEVTNWSNAKLPFGVANLKVEFVQKKANGEKWKNGVIDTVFDDAGEGAKSLLDHSNVK